MIRIKSNSSVSQRTIRQINRRIRQNVRKYIYSGQLHDEIGELILEIVINRTLSGKDEHGRNFVPYSQKYRRMKKEAGLYSGKADLNFYGDMLNSLAFVQDGGPLKGRIVALENKQTGSKLTTKELADIHQNGLRGMPARPFMGWGRESQNDKALLAAIRRKMFRKLRKFL